MPQIFSPGTNTVFRTALVLSPFLLVGSLFAIYRLNYSSWATQVGVPIDQPVPFSHEYHVAGLGIDCRYRRAGGDPLLFQYLFWFLGSGQVDTPIIIGGNPVFDAPANLE